MDRQDAKKTLAVAIDHFMRSGRGQRERQTLNMLIEQAKDKVDELYPKSSVEVPGWLKRLSR
jgi:hypothetical protein